MRAELQVRYCESCHKKTMVAQVQLDRKTIWLCEKCLGNPYHHLKAKRESLEGPQTA